MPSENETYEQWRSAPEGERWELEGRLFQQVVGHALAVVWTKLQEPNPDLAQEIALAVFRNLSNFKGESKFSTWVHAIGRNKVKELIRNRVRWRKIFEQNVLLRREEEEQEVNPTVIEEAGEAPDFDTPILVDELCEGLSQRDALLLRCKYELMGSDEIAAILGTTREATDSRWARLRPKLQEKLVLRR
jgi:RNA polymerase sigma factor (sigma-70 family)